MTKRLTGESSTTSKRGLGRVVDQWMAAGRVERGGIGSSRWQPFGSASAVVMLRISISVTTAPVEPPAASRWNESLHRLRLVAGSDFRGSYCESLRLFANFKTLK